MRTHRETQPSAKPCARKATIHHLERHSLELRSRDAVDRANTLLPYTLARLGDALAALDSIFDLNFS